MEKLIEFRKSLISKDKIVFFSDFNFVVEQTKHVAIIGRSGSGKSSILKSLIGIYSATSLFVNGTKFSNNIDLLYRKVAVVLNDTSFICDSVYKELAFSLKNMNLNEKEIDDKVLILADYFKFTDYLEYDPSLLNNQEKIILKILSFIIISPDVIAIDDLLIYLSNKQKDLLIKYINKNNITLLLTTSDIEDTLYIDYIYIIDQGRIIAEGTKESIYSEEKLLNRIGYGLPFMIDLSTQLKCYEVIDEIYTDKKKLVDAIWK